MGVKAIYKTKATATVGTATSTTSTDATQQARPIAQITGSSEFNEVFFSGARTPADLVVGGVNQGWKVAMGLLAYERGASTLGQQFAFERELTEIGDAARRFSAGWTPATLAPL